MEDEKEYENLADDTILGKKAYEFVMDTHGALKKKRKPFETVWAECQDAYRTIERKTFFQGTMPYCSNDLRDAVLTIVPKYAKAVWYADIPFELIPQGEQGDDEKIVDVNQKVLEWDFRNLKIYLKYVDAIFQKSIYGTAIVKTAPHWEEITKNLSEWQEKKIAGQKSLPGRKELVRKKEMQRLFMGTDFIVTDLMDFWIDPQTTRVGMRDAVEYSDCIESICSKWTDLKLGEKSGIYKKLDLIEDYYIGSKGSKDQAAKKRIRQAGRVNPDNPEGQGKSKSEMGNKKYDLLECYAEFDLGEGHVEPCLITIGAEKECIRLQRWDGDKPYLSSRHTPNGYNKEFYGTGLIETNLSNHYERNATRKQIVTARTMGLNMEILSTQNGIPNKPDRLRTAPNKVHYVKDLNSVKPFEKPIGQVLQSGVAHETNLKAETQQSIGNTPYVQGSDTSKINDTAAGINLLQQAGNEKFTLPLQVDEAEILEPYVKRCLQNNVDYRKDAFVIRLTDKKPIKVYPEDLSANFDVYAKGSSELQNKQIRQSGLLKAWEISLGAAQIEAGVYGQPLTKFHKLKEEIFSNLGISQPENFLIDPEKIQDQQNQTLAPDLEQILLRRMAEGVAPPMPILIQPGEDYKDHYEKHMAFINTEEFQAFPDEIKAIWFAHVRSYQTVFKYMDQKKEIRKEKEIETKEVAVPA